MDDTMTRYLEAIDDTRPRWALRKILLPQVDRTGTQMLSTAGLVISSGGATTAKSGGSDAYAIVKGVFVKLASGTAMPALTNINAAQSSFVLAVFFMDGAGNLTVQGSSSATTLAGCKFTSWNPQEGKAVVGCLIITNSGGAFTGGTTALDTATTVYLSPTGDWDPTCLV